jgi:acyl-CoA synthetase (AMP-forming)/AMP-acid ligase II
MPSAVENFGTVTDKALQLLPSKVALEQGSVTLTYGQLDSRAQAVAQMLEDLGVIAGERVLLLFPNTHSAKR